jgi:hypothetical protein
MNADPCGLGSMCVPFDYSVLVSVDMNWMCELTAVGLLPLPFIILYV